MKTPIASHVGTALAVAVRKAHGDGNAPKLRYLNYSKLLEGGEDCHLFSMTANLVARDPL